MALTRYVVELPQLEFEEMIRDLQNQIAAVARYKLAVKVTHGAAHPNVLHINTQIARMERAVTALYQAQHLALHPQPIFTAKQSPARNLSDDMPFVYGKPRNDPRTPKRKL